MENTMKYVLASSIGGTRVICTYPLIFRMSMYLYNILTAPTVAVYVLLCYYGSRYIIIICDMRHADANFSADERAASDPLLRLSRILVQMTEKNGKTLLCESYRVLLLHAEYFRNNHLRFIYSSNIVDLYLRPLWACSRFDDLPV